MSSGVAYGISRIIVDDLKLKKIQNSNVSCPNFKLVDSKSFDEKRSSQYKSDCVELKAMKEELNKLPIDSEEERNKLQNKIDNLESKINFIKNHKQLSVDEIDISTFEFNSPECLDPLVIGITKCLEDIDSIKVDVKSKQEESKRELNKKAKQQAFKRLVNSLGINPIENRFRILHKTIVDLAKNRDLWLIKFFNKSFTHPEFENSKNQLKQYLTRVPHMFEFMIEKYDGKNEEGIYNAFLKQQSINMKAHEYIQKCEDEKDVDSKSYLKLKSMMNFMDYYKKHQMFMKEKAKFIQVVKAYDNVLTTCVDKQVKEEEIIQFYLDVINSFRGIDKDFDYGIAFASEINSMIPIRFGNLFKDLTKNKELKKDKELVYQDELNNIISVDDVFYNKSIYAKIGESCYAVEDKANKNAKVAYGLRIIAEVIRQIELIDVTHKSDNYTITIIYDK